MEDSGSRRGWRGLEEGRGAERRICGGSAEKSRRTAAWDEEIAGSCRRDERCSGGSVGGGRGGREGGDGEGSRRGGEGREEGVFGEGRWGGESVIRRKGGREGEEIITKLQMQRDRTKKKSERG